MPDDSLHISTSPSETHKKETCDCPVKVEMHVNRYWAYGLRICSEIECPELPVDQEASGAPDVTIQLLPPVTSLPESLEQGYYEVRQGMFRMNVSQVAHYRVENGCRMLVEPLVGVSVDQTRLFLLGSAMGALLYQRGLFPLHGSAVETQWGAMIFVGPQGVGKSTLAAQFHRRGYRLLSDDVCAVVSAPDGLWVLPALAQFRLCSDAYERLGTPAQGRFHVDKFIVPMGEGYCPDPIPLKGIHILGDQESGAPKFELLSGFDKLQRLFENLYRLQYLQGQSTQGELMQMAAVIARNATLASVTRSRDPEALDQFVTFLESSWMEHFGPAKIEEKN